MVNSVGPGKWARHGIIRAIRRQHDPEKWEPVFGQDHAQEEMVGPFSRRNLPRRHGGPAPHRRRSGHNPLMAPLVVFAAVVLVAAIYVAYILWPRWPQGLVSLNAPSLPIVVSVVAFNIEPAAIRVGVQRRPGTQERVDLSYLWPSLAPPDPAVKPAVGAPPDPNERLFVTIASGDTTLPLIIHAIWWRGRSPAFQD